MWRRKSRKHTLRFLALMISADISFSYDDEKEIFSSFSLSVEKREHLLIIAPPESGKTTLGHIITGSIPKYRGGRLSGSFFIDGTDILALDIPQRMKIAARVSQNTDEMLLFSSVEEELSFPLENLGLSCSEIESRTEYALSLFGLERYRKVSTAELSGGEKRRLLLAVLFAIDPEVYILDEAFDELSPWWRKQLAELIRHLDRTVIALGSHMLSEYDGTFDRAITIDECKALSYEKSSFVFPAIAMHEGNDVLRVENVVIEREHRSSGDLTSFELSVPWFELKEGECVTLLGDNGSGKSSFSRMMSGLLKEKTGTVSINGKALSQKERRGKVAFLMQNPFEELFLPTVIDELESTEASQNAIEEALSLFSLVPDAYVQELSYGKAKLLQAAVFYLLDRRFAVFDEMDSALSSSDFIKAVRAYLDKGIALLVITHDLGVASALPGRKLMIEEGVLCEYK